MNAPDLPLPPRRLDRRTAIKWVMTATAAMSVLDHAAFAAAAPAAGAAKGYGTDPDLMKAWKPGEAWPLTFTASQRATAVALCDVILPADEKGPAASTVGTHDFIDEWISAPYPGHAADRKTILDGFTWLDAEAQKRFRKAFTALDARQQAAICDDVCHLPEAKPEHRQGAQFFRRFRDLAAGGYYTTPEGMKDIGYTGNVALEKYEGPPPEVLRKLGIA
ncbi:MAG: gluconate 2-dehydrogenase subunit 3 family protein [Opitutaceae bacterium]|nr:gluconate 2-dehydrogenase subunit 3 family protein [Opitutaceae bacterium]